MDDQKIIDLYWERSPSAITQTEKKYGKYCYTIAYNILTDHQYSEECVNDTYLQVWDVIPPQRPDRFRAFLGRITRNLALNRYNYENAEKRGGGAVTIALEELEGCLSACNEDAADRLALQNVLNAFLTDLRKTDRQIFLQRYWYFLEIRQIAREMLMTEGQVKMRLHRLRGELKCRLEQEGLL